MICSFDFCLNKKYYTTEQENNLIDNVLENVNRSANADGTLTKTTGYVDNYRVTIHDDKMFFNGSLSKFYLMSNVVELSREDIPKALKELRRKTQMPIQYGEIVRVDFAVNVFLEHKFNSYLPFFGESHGYTKGTDNYGGVRFGKTGANQKIEIAIYDKLAELRANARDVYKMVKETLDDNGEKGIMRIEMRLKKLARKTLLPSASRLTVAHLLLARVNHKLIKLWKQYYEAIDKNMKLRLPKDIGGLKELKDMLAAKQIEVEGLNQVLFDIDEMAKAGNWSAKKKSTTKAEIKKLSQTKFQGTLPDYIIEIEKKVKQNSKLSEWISDWGFE